MFETLEPGGGLLVWLLATVALWGVPIALVVWFIRTLNAMLGEQRAIAEQLRLLVQQGRGSASGL